jgi:hypothetical protein
VSFISDKLFGVRHILNNLEPISDAQTLNFVGFTVGYDASKKWISITNPAAPLLNGATKLATPETLALRGLNGEAHFGGTCNFVNINVTGTLGCVDIEATGDITCDDLTVAGEITCGAITATGSISCSGLTCDGAASVGDALYVVNEIGCESLSATVAITAPNLVTDTLSALTGGTISLPDDLSLGGVITGTSAAFAGQLEAADLVCPNVYADTIQSLAPSLVLKSESTTFLTGTGANAAFAGSVTLVGLTASGAVALNGATTVADITATGTTKYKLASRSLTRSVMTGALPEWVLSANLPSFSIKNAAPWAGAYQALVVTTVPFLRMDLGRLPPSVLTGISVYVLPTGGHPALPGGLPGFALYKEQIATGVTTLIGSVVAAPANVAAYQAGFTLSLSVASEVINRNTHSYYVRFFGEYGQNTVWGLLVFPPLATFTVTAMDDS